jgi:hypothetical protein
MPLLLESLDPVNGTRDASYKSRGFAALAASVLLMSRDAERRIAFGGKRMLMSTIEWGLVSGLLLLALD